MSATAADPEPSAEDQAYFLALEQSFLRLRGRATLLAAADWQTAAVWRRQGIPTDLVVRVMEELFSRQRQRRGRSISSLRYFAAAVEAAWEEVLELQAGGRQLAPEPLRIDQRLARLAAALPDDLPEHARWAERIARLCGGPEEVESALMALDQELLDSVAARMSAAASAELEQDLERALVTLRGRLEPGELAVAGERLRRQLVRRRHRLPVLSLFAPEAAEAGGANGSPEEPG